MSGTPVGEIRPSQLLWSYGPGALIDLPSMSVITMGVDHWDGEKCVSIQEVRLLASVRRVLGPQVHSLRLPPIAEEDKASPYSPEAQIGVPVQPFPRWLRCVECGLLSPYDSGLFKLRENSYRPEATCFVHTSCLGRTKTQKLRNSVAVPARFLIACRAGHLDDFAWHWYVHDGESKCKGTLKFFERGASLQSENLWVKCGGCDKAKSMAQAFWQTGRDQLPACRGRHPHLNKFDKKECKEQPRAILLGATNSWFPVTLSALEIPQIGETLAQLVASSWDSLRIVESAAEIGLAVRLFKQQGQLPWLERFRDEDIWAAIKAHRKSGAMVEQGDIQSEIKSPEWDVLTMRPPPTNYPHFMSKEAGIPLGFESQITRVLLLERLREVNALLGFTRVEPPDEGEGDDAAPRAPIGLPPLDWVPAAQVHGEGIFIQFNAKALKAWGRKKSVQDVDKQLQEGHSARRKERKRQDTNEGYPGFRYIMLHTLAHLLIRELSLECGYNAASIRERIYADVDDGRDQAGLLIYTAAADSDGTLGGLVELGKPENLGRLLHRALNRARICASDPLCAEHDPRKDRSLHGAACHACSFVSETSCERGNRHLDRSLVVPTLVNSDSALFTNF